MERANRLGEAAGGERGNHPTYPVLPARALRHVLRDTWLPHNRDRGSEGKRRVFLTCAFALSKATSSMLNGSGQALSSPSGACLADGLQIMTPRNKSVRHQQLRNATVISTLHMQTEGPELAFMACVAGDRCLEVYLAIEEARVYFVKERGASLPCE